MSEVKYPEVEVQLTGTDGNAFAIIGNVSRALKRAGLRDAAAAFSAEAMQCDSYDALLVLAMQTVEVS
jgi:hypothetical protein